MQQLLQQNHETLRFHLLWNEEMSGCLKSLWAECREYKVYNETLWPSYFHLWGQLLWLLRIVTFKEMALHRAKGISCKCTLKNRPPHWTESSSPWSKACKVSKRWHAYARSFLWEPVTILPGGFCLSFLSLFLHPSLGKEETTVSDKNLLNASF